MVHKASNIGGRSCIGSKACQIMFFGASIGSVGTLSCLGQNACSMADGVIGGTIGSNAWQVKEKMQCSAYKFVDSMSNIFYHVHAQKMQQLRSCM